MTTFPAVTGPRLIRALGKLGFEVIRVKGSHHFLKHQDGRCTVVPCRLTPTGNRKNKLRVLSAFAVQL